MSKISYIGSRVYSINLRCILSYIACVWWASSPNNFNGNNANVRNVNSNGNANNNDNVNNNNGVRPDSY